MQQLPPIKRRLTGWFFFKYCDSLSNVHVEIWQSTVIFNAEHVVITLLLWWLHNKSVHSKLQEFFLCHPGFGTIQLLGFVCNYGRKLRGWLDIFKVFSSIYYHMISMILPSILYLNLTNAGSWGGMVPLPTDNSNQGSSSSPPHHRVSNEPSPLIHINHSVSVQNNSSHIVIFGSQTLLPVSLLICFDQQFL